MYEGELGKAYQEQQKISRSGQKAADLTGMKLEANETLALEKQGVQPTDCTAKYVMFECEVRLFSHVISLELQY